MPHKKKGMPVEPVQLSFAKELVDQLVPGPMSPEGLESMFRQLKKAVIERALGAEITEHLGYAAGEAKPEGSANSRNGASAKTMTARCGSTCRATAREASSRSSSASTSGASRGSTPRSSQCTRAA